MGIVIKKGITYYAQCNVCNELTDVPDLINVLDKE